MYLSYAAREDAVEVSVDCDKLRSALEQLLEAGAVDSYLQSVMKTLVEHPFWTDWAAGSRITINLASDEEK